MSAAKKMIVDCHVNVYDDDMILPLFHQGSSNAVPGGFKLQANADRVYEGMKNVDKAIVFSLRYKDSAGIDGNDEVTARAVARYPDKFVGFACIDPRMPDCMDLLVHAIEDLKLKGVKFGPIYNGVSLLDPRMDPIYAYLQKNNIPLTMHMGTTFGRNAPIDEGRPLNVDTVAMRYPDLKMIMAHMGHPWYEECIVVIRKQPNVYAEVSALTMLPTSHLTWSGVWLGIATDAVNRARAYLRGEARKKPGASLPGLARLGEATALLNQMKSNVVAALRLYEPGMTDEDRISSPHFAVAMNNLKVASSRLVVQVVNEAMLAAGLAGYRNDSPYSLGRHLRDAHSAALMVNNDRILGNTANLQIGRAHV